MDAAVWIVFGLAAVVLCGSAFLAGGSPKFWYGLARVALPDMLNIAKLLFKSASPEELERLGLGPGPSHNNTAAGQSSRPFHREKGW